MSFQVLKDRDGQWLRQSFLQPRMLTKFRAQRNQYFRQVDYKFVDSTIGGNYAINNPPQYCRYSDIRRSGRFILNKEEQGKFDQAKGLGRYWSESIDDNSLLCHFGFGVADFNTLSRFLTGFYNHDVSVMARTGRGSPGLFYQVGNTLGMIVTLPFAPILFGASAIRFLANIPATKFYYLKKAMPLYWNAVNTIANGIAVNQNIIPRVMQEQELRAWLTSGELSSESEYPQPSEADLRRYSEQFAQMLPGVFYPNGGVDVHNIASRTARMDISIREQIYQKIKQESSVATEDSFATTISQMYDEAVNNTPRVYKTFTDYYTAYFASALGEDMKAGDNAEVTEITGRGEFTAATDASGEEVKTGWLARAFDFGKAEAADGSNYVTFRVNHTGTASETFNNSTRENDMASKFNSTAATARASRFGWAEYNVADSGLVGGVQAVMGSVRDLLTGALDGVGVSGLMALMGNAYVDIPDQWDQSRASMASMSYTMHLRSWSGDKLSRYQNIYIPLSCIMAAALPISAGTHSYQSPFLCEMFLQGRAQTRLGIISDLTIERGVGNVGWDQSGNALGIDVNFTVTDLSKVMHMPIAAGFSLNPAKGVFDEDSMFNDYLAVLGALGLNDQTQPMRRLNLALTRKAVSFRQWTSPAKWANMGVQGTIPGRIWTAIASANVRP